MMFDYLPPIRLACISSLQHPAYKGPCLWPNCSRPHCLGNKLVLLSKKPAVRLQIHLPHHKNQTAWQQDGPIHFEVPAALADLLYLWLSQGHPELCQHCFLIGTPSAPRVFLTPTGKAYDCSSMQYFWHTWLKKHGGVAHMPPSMCRHIFVDERRSSDRVEGPSDRGAAMAMGHSQDAWNKHYEMQRHFHPRDCQAAVNAMDTWRDNLTLPCPGATTSGGLASSAPSAIDTWRHCTPPGSKAAKGSSSLLCTLVPSQTRKDSMQHAQAESDEEINIVASRKRQRGFIIDSDDET
ncbi:TPA: hypothetical protein ACH3X2_000803 [Trebouxia sp. C0005]